MGDLNRMGSQEGTGGCSCPLQRCYSSRGAALLRLRCTIIYFGQGGYGLLLQWGMPTEYDLLPCRGRLQQKGNR